MVPGTRTVFQFARGTARLSYGSCRSLSRWSGHFHGEVSSIYHYYHLRQLRPLVRSMSSDAVIDPGVHLVSPGLLQLTFLRYNRWTDDPAAVCWCRVLDGIRPHHAGATSVPLASGSEAGGLQMTTLVYTVRCPAWLRLTWPLTVSWSLMWVVVSCVLPTRGLVSSGDLQQLRRPMLFRCCWQEAVEQPSSWS